MEHSEQINSIKEKIEKNKQQLAILQGRYSEVIKQLETHNIKSLEEAEKWLVKVDAELTKSEKEFEKKFETLKKEMIAAIKKAYNLSSDEEAEAVLL